MSRFASRMIRYYGVVDQDGAKAIVFCTSTFSFLRATGSLTPKNTCILGIVS